MNFAVAVLPALITSAASIAVALITTRRKRDDDKR